MRALQLQRGGEGGQGGKGEDGGEVGEEGVWGGGGGGGDERGVVGSRVLIRGEPGGGGGREVGELGRSCWVRLVQAGGRGEEGEGGGRGAGGEPVVELLVQQLLDSGHRVAQVRLQHLAKHCLQNGFVALEYLQISSKFWFLCIVEMCAKVFKWKAEGEEQYEKQHCGERSKYPACNLIFSFILNQ